MLLSITNQISNGAVRMNPDLPLSRPGEVIRVNNPNGLVQQEEGVASTQSFSDINHHGVGSANPRIPAVQPSGEPGVFPTDALDETEYPESRLSGKRASDADIETSKRARPNEEGETVGQSWVLATVQSIEDALVTLTAGELVSCEGDDGASYTWGEPGVNYNFEKISLVVDLKQSLNSFRQSLDLPSNDPGQEPVKFFGLTATLQQSKVEKFALIKDCLKRFIDIANRSRNQVLLESIQGVIDAYNGLIRASDSDDFIIELAPARASQVRQTLDDLQRAFITLTAGILNTEDQIEVRTAIIEDLNECLKQIRHELGFDTVQASAVPFPDGLGSVTDSEWEAASDSIHDHLGDIEDKFEDNAGVLELVQKLLHLLGEIKGLD